MDPKFKKRRGFIFITFKEESTVKKCLEKKFHNVCGTKVTDGKEGLVCIFYLFFLLTVGGDVHAGCVLYQFG